MAIGEMKRKASLRSDRNVSSTPGSALCGESGEAGSIGWEGKTRGGGTSEKAIRMTQARDAFDLDSKKYLNL